MDISIESIREGDEEQRNDLRRQAFGGTEPFDASLPTPDPDRTVAAYVADGLVATVVTHGFHMWWGGRSVPCGGVSGVVVRPETRGQGIAKALLRESLDRMSARGEVISALYPTTSTLYRSMGFEVGGYHQWRHLPLDLIPTGADGTLSWRRVEFGDAAIATVYEAMAPSIDGFLAPGEFWWRRVPRLWANESSTNRYAYVGSRGGEDVAAVVYKYKPSDDRLYDLVADVLAGIDGDAVSAALAFLAANGTTAGHVETTLPTSLLTQHVPHMQHTKATGDWPWMLRLVDAPGAIAARGFPTSVRGRVELDIVDDVIPANAGAHVLEVEGGTASLIRGGHGRVPVTASDLAALYAGADVRAIDSAGRLAGASPSDLDLLAAAFVSTPAMPFFF